MTVHHMTLKQATAFAAQKNSYFTDNFEPRDRFENALACFRALDGLLCGHKIGGTLDAVATDDFVSLQRLIAREFQDVYNAEHGEG